MLKTTLKIALAVTLAIMVTACGDDEPGKPSSSTTHTVTTTMLCHSSQNGSAAASNAQCSIIYDTQALTLSAATVITVDGSSRQLELTGVKIAYNETARIYEVAAGSNSGIASGITGYIDTNNAYYRLAFNVGGTHYVLTSNPVFFENIDMKFLHTTGTVYTSQGSMIQFAINPTTLKGSAALMAFSTTSGSASRSFRNFTIHQLNASITATGFTLEADTTTATGTPYNSEAAKDYDITGFKATVNLVDDSFTASGKMLSTTLNSSGTAYRTTKDEQQ